MTSFRSVIAIAAISEKKRALKQKKYYPVDSGLRYAVTNVSTKDLGKSLEILVFLQLKNLWSSILLATNS